MFGMKKAIAAWSWKKRLFVGLPIILLGAWLTMRVTIWTWIENVTDADPDENEISYDATFFRLNGDFGATKVRLDHYFPDGTPGPSYLADRVVFHTPGLLWLYWNTLRGAKYMPDAFGMTMENARDAKTSDQTPGNYTNLPYDQVGCGRPGLLTKADLVTMGLPVVRRDVTLTLKRKDDQLSTLDFDLLTPGAGELKLEMDVTAQRPIPWRMVLERMATAELRSADLRMTDRGFVALRTAYCGKAAGLAPDRFHAYHMDAFAKRVAESGIYFDAPTLARYGPFAAHGGELRLRGTHLPRLRLLDFAAMDLGRQVEMIPTALSYNGGQESSFQYLPLNAVRPAAAIAPTVAAIAPAPVPIMPAAGASPHPAAAASMHSEATAPGVQSIAQSVKPTAGTVGTPAGAVAAGDLQLVDYKQLKGREGSHIEIITSNGTTRRGTLVAYSPYMSTLKLDADAGGFTLSVPGDSVDEVRVIPR